MTSLSNKTNPADQPIKNLIITIKGGNPTADEIAAFKKNFPNFQTIFQSHIGKWIATKPLGLSEVHYVSLPEKAVVKVALLVDQESNRHSLHVAFFKIEREIILMALGVSVHWDTFVVGTENLARQKFLNKIGSQD